MLLMPFQERLERSCSPRREKDKLIKKISLQTESTASGMEGEKEMNVLSTTDGRDGRWVEEEIRKEVYNCLQSLTQLS